MRLICPHCQVTVTVPESAAGAPTPCPQCGQSIKPPALTGAAIDAAPEPTAPQPVTPASRVAPAPGGLTAQTPVAHAPGSPAGAPWLHLTLRRDVAHWLAPAALVVAFLLTFFTWVAVAPNGTRIYTQNAWQAAFGGTFTTDLVGDRVMQAEAELNAHRSSNVWLIFYLLLLIPTAALAVADRAFARNPASVPDIIRTVWPHRQTVVAGLCAALLIMLFLPLMTGFGLRSAAIAAATPQASAAPATPEPSTAEIAERDLRRDMKVACYGLRRTAWLDLALAAQMIAVIGAGMSIWLDRHPTAPDPRVEIYC
jgi:hypothetical protein